VEGLGRWRLRAGVVAGGVTLQGGPLLVGWERGTLLRNGGERGKGDAMAGGDRYRKLVNGFEGHNKKMGVRKDWTQLGSWWGGKGGVWAFSRHITVKRGGGCWSFMREG